MTKQKSKLFAISTFLFCLFSVQLLAIEQAKKTDMNTDWSIQSSAEISASGERISNLSYQAKDWFSGDIPATVLSILRQNKDFGNLFLGDNITDIDTKQFQVPWWYRKEFTIDDYNQNSVYRLSFEGLNYKANIWLNGNLIAEESKLEGAFGMWEMDVSAFLDEKNVLAIEVIPPVKGDLTIGFVDWNPKAPDENMGLWRGVELLQSGAVSVKSPFVTSVVDKNNLKHATLRVSSIVTNHTSVSQIAKVLVTIEELGQIEKKVILSPHETRAVFFDTDDYPSLKVENPRLWWPNNLGSPEMYNMRVDISIRDNLSHSLESRFGIREIEEYKTSNGDKGYQVNGKKVLIKGGGWVDDMLLADSDEKVRAQVEYTRHMNLNCIRLEGFWGRNKTLYNACDENGILLMIGWSCHWEWEPYCGRPETDFMAITGDAEIERHAQSFRDQVLYLRNHPSVFLWVYGSDKLPVASLERKLNTYIREVDSSRPILSSCKSQDFGTEFYNISEVSGDPGVKMLGPYGYVPPVYWYIDTISGGAYGFNTETGPGPQVPPYESIRKMIPTNDLWPINEQWDFHCNRYEFGSLDRYLHAFNGRYGEAKNVEEFAFKSQISNYEAIRPMFEAFQVNKIKATGVVQWMLNSSWPALFWQLYDYYMLPNGAFYGTKKACEPLQAIYNYKDDAIYFVNDLNHQVNHLRVQVKVFDIHSNEVFSTIIPISVGENSATKLVELPEFEKLSMTYFVDLRVLDEKDIEVTNNFYWLSQKDDVMDFSKTTWVYTPTSSLADLKGLNTMPKVSIDSSFSLMEDDTHMTYRCTLENTEDHIAFFIEVGIIDKGTDETIVPVFWSDNYISLLPGEKRILEAKILKSLIQGKDTDFRIKFWNEK